MLYFHNSQGEKAGDDPLSKALRGRKRGAIWRRKTSSMRANVNRERGASEDGESRDLSTKKNEFHARCS